MRKKAIEKKKTPRKVRAAKPVTDANVTPAARGTPDPRVPPPGTLLQKRDRHGKVRCECTVEESGFRYSGESYRSLSAAAMAAAKDLGLNNRTQNGFAFWGITKLSRRPGDLLAALERVWERYQRTIESLVKGGVTDENRSQVAAAISKHGQAIEGLRDQVG